MENLGGRAAIVIQAVLNENEGIEELEIMEGMTYAASILMG